MLLKSFFINSEYKDIKYCREEIKKISKKYDFFEEFHSYIELALGEALTNVIKHGQKKLIEKPGININVFLENNSILLDISFEGEIIDENILNKGKHLNDSLNINTLSESGRGIFLIHTLMDEVEYYQENDLVKIKMKKFLKKNEK
ncbi:serine/threonine-protein kinase RsbW [Hypnocyclicus thermotrophus]|uniref:Serine/threonine-protein kinase RsbW n=1 Tax=Hypnocyclicus thermotrophus TaxID=1627895 RepID=A0AA46DZS2_9FUSO|nr:ATP-binding protein [Hypnocyclicus thermotrophus]TDT71920.1 serine/threonine-protein kinase RsbW [Hypnocyclicus thermotrophus]